MLLKPDIKLKRVTDITPQLLESYGIKALLLDVDNTLSTHHGMVLTDGLEAWLDNMKKSGIKLSLLSNSKTAMIYQPKQGHFLLLQAILRQEQRMNKPFLFIKGQEKGTPLLSSLPITAASSNTSIPSTYPTRS